LLGVYQRRKRCWVFPKWDWVISDFDFLDLIFLDIHAVIRSRIRERYLRILWSSIELQIIKEKPMEDLRLLLFPKMTFMWSIILTAGKLSLQQSTFRQEITQNWRWQELWIKWRWKWCEMIFLIFNLFEIKFPIKKSHCF
jgi:hypothetical protein